MQCKFKGKTIVISGIARGIGKTLALQSAQLGMQVAGFDIKQEELNILKEELSELGVKNFLQVIDIRNEHACYTFIDNCLSELERIDFLVNNAGITHIAPGNETSPQHTKNLMDINFMGMVYLSHAALPEIIKNKGTIAGVSSVAGYSPLLYRTAYAASKHAVWGYLSSLRAEMKEKDVQVLIICPSFVSTDLQEKHKKYFNNNTNEALTTTFVASQILKAISKRKSLALIGKTAKQVYWLNRFFPRLYEKIMINKTKL